MDNITGGASLTEIQRAYDHFFSKGTTLAKIKDAALGDRLFPSSIPSNGSIGVRGRSIAWKLFLLAHEPLETSPVRAHALVEALRTSREAYKELLLEKMRAPDDSYDADLVLPGTAGVKVREWKRNSGANTSANALGPSGGAGVVGVKSSSPSATTGAHSRSDSPANLEFNNPLSLHDENPWNTWFASVDLRKTILQDVERTFPDIAYFRRPDVQLELTNILFLFSVQHPSIGYRQGMHELLAPLYHAVAYDAIMQEREGIAINADSSLKELCSPVWAAADAWALLEVVMQGVSRWYEWQEHPPSVPDSATNAATPSPSGPGRRNSPLPAHVRLDARVGQQGGLKPYVAPIVQTCNAIQGTLLRTTDPQLFQAVQATKIEPQIYGIRWLRLLFTREFSMPDALRLWDGLFACDPTFDLAQWVCVAMLIRIRNHLIPADYAGQLTCLLRYPTPPNAEDSTPHHAVLLLRQALALQMAPHPSTGASIMIENRTILGIPIEVPTSAPAQTRKGHLGRHQMASVPGRDASHTQGHSRVSTSSMGLPEMIARGLLERGESLGINKTLMSAVSELKRNIPDLAASLVRPAYHTEAAFPLEDERPPQERPPWEPRTRFEMERDISQLRARDKQIGDSLGWIVDVLLQDEEETENGERLKKEKREAIESLAYIRDVLISDATVLEDDRLVGEEEALRRKARVERQESTTIPGVMGSSPSRPGLPSTVSPPAPLPVIDSRPKTTGNRHRSQGSLPGLSFSQPQASRNAETPVGGGPTLAPWNYTRSGFSGTRTLPSASLPRPPPPTSRNLRRGGGQSGDQTPTREEGVGYSDPLGALR